MERRRFLASAGALVASAAAVPVPSWASRADQALEQYIAKAPRAGSLRVLVPFGGEANVSRVAQRFTELSGVQVELIISDLEDINTRLVEDTMVQAQEYDVALPATFGLPDLVAAGAIQPMDPFHDRYPDSYVPADHLYPFGDHFNDKLYGFQTDGDVYLLFLRKDLGEAARARGQDAFGDGWAAPASWDQLDAMMRALHAPSEGVYGGLLYRAPGYIGWEYISRLSAEGCRLFDADFNPTFLTTDAEKVIEDMRRSQEVQHPATMTMSLFESWELFQKNNVLATVGWGGSQKAFNAPGAPLRGRLSYASLPKGKGPRSSYFNWGWSYVIAKSALSPELAYLFCALGVSAETSTRAVQVRDGYFDPFMPQHYEDPMIRDVYSDEFLKVHRAAMETAGPDLYIPGVGSYMAALNEGVFHMINGDVTVAEGLRGLQSEWNATTFEFGRAQQRRFYESVGVDL